MCELPSFIRSKSHYYARIRPPEPSAACSSCRRTGSIVSASCTSFTRSQVVCTADKPRSNVAEISNSYSKWFVVSLHASRLCSRRTCLTFNKESHQSVSAHHTTCLGVRYLPERFRKCQCQLTSRSLRVRPLSSHRKAPQSPCRCTCRDNSAWKRCHKRGAKVLCDNFPI